MTVAQSLKFEACLWNDVPNNRSLKLAKPKSLSFCNSKPKFDVCKIRCSSSRRDPVDQFILDVLPAQLLTVTFVLPDENREFIQEVDAILDRDGNPSSIVPSKDPNDDILDDVVSLLFENTHRCMSSTFMVSSNIREAYLRGFKHLQMEPEINPLNTISCTEVKVHALIIGAIDDKFKKIQTRDDLKALLHHLRSMEGVRTAGCKTRSMLKEKKTCYSHVFRQ